MVRYQGADRGQLLRRGSLDREILTVIAPERTKEGELTGLVFDGNIEAMASDWVFMPSITRSIHVDIRYVMWVMDAVDNADHLLTEMGVTPTI